MELNLPMAQAMIIKVLETAAREFDRPICVSVCDSAGLLMAFNRVEGGHARSVDISQAKAYTAARMGVDTDAFLARLQNENLSISYFCDPKMTALPGGIVLKDPAGKVLGGIGVSGLKAEEDAVVARAAAELLQA
ncbi:GlcG/HbpS family heme-binding protein [Pelobacter seleniigenes]|uniref:GlcG/HbpS family heme-binding protein n=1 Tax=Pelobacter seleniigenes TaxID=407188 RepID=UPI0004A78014|nr:heme-binding protein [Pelobacter seleniigenes]